jgi:CHAD domain-containing protein
MSYELRHGETLGDSLRRICRKQIDGAIAVANGEVKTDDTPVHEMRKHLKKARAALRLVRKEIGRGLFREQNRCLRDVGRLTSEIRDAEVRLQTVRELQEVTQRHRRSAYRKLEVMLTLEMENFMAAFAEWQTQAVPMLEQAGSAVDRWTLDQFNCKQLRRVVQGSYKQARKALAKATANPTAENFHAFRTKAKTLWYQLRILRPVNPVVLKTLSDDLRRLGNLLGRAHDLSFLGERLRSEHGNSQWQREGHKLLATIEVSQTDLQHSAAERVNTSSPSGRAISALALRVGSESGRANHRTPSRKRSSLRFSREFWWKKPEKFSFFRLRIDIEQGDAGFGKLERSASQSRNDSRKIRFVADQHQNFRAMPLEDGSQLAHSKSGREQLVLSQFGLQVFRSDFRGLRCARQRAGHNQIRSHLETREKFRHATHFFFSKISKRPLIIRFLPVRPIGLAMSKEIKLHIDLIRVVT